MRKETLLELAEKWEREDKQQARDGSPEAAIGNAKADGERCGLKLAAHQLRQLVALLG